MSAVFLPTAPDILLEGSAATACNAAGITDSRARLRMAQFFAGLRALGLHDDFVDGACFRPGFQKVSGSFISLKGYAATTGGGPTLTEGGLRFDGVDDYVWHAVPNLAGTGRTLFWWGGASYTGGTPMILLAAANSTNALIGGYHRIGVDTAVSGAHSLSYDGFTLASTASDTAFQQNTPSVHMLAIRDTNAGGTTALSLHMDGRTKKVSSSTCAAIAGPLDRIYVSCWRSGGGSVDGFFPSMTASWLAFNTALTDDQITSVRALMESTLCPRVLGVVEGDSLSTYLTWPPDATMGANVRGLLDTDSNLASGGATAAYILSNYATDVRPLKPAAGEQKWLFLLAGTNDAASTPTAADIFASLSSIWALARADGFKVAAFTVMLSGDTSNNAKRNSLNALIRAAANEYDALIDTDRFFIRLTGSATYYTNTTYFNGDQIHLIAAGNAALGAEVARCMKLQDIPL